MERLLKSWMCGILVLVLACSSLSAQVVVDPDDDPDGGGTVWANYRCDYFTTCPAGSVKLRTLTGNYRGCMRGAGVTCTGGCIFCSGSINPAYICVYRVDDSCITGTGPVVDCGVRVHVLNTCAFAAAPPAGEGFPTPNSCYCTGAGTGTITTTDGCSFRNCV